MPAPPANPPEPPQPEPPRPGSGAPEPDPLSALALLTASGLGRWLILTSGLALLLAAVLIPAHDDADRAAWHRDRALDTERELLLQLEQERATLDAIHAGDETMLLALAASELRLIPHQRAVVLNADGPGLFATPMARVARPEPPRPHAAPDSTLARLSLHPSHRLWLLAGSMLAVLVGLLPPAARPPA